MTDGGSAGSASGTGGASGTGSARSTGGANTAVAADLPFDPAGIQYFTAPAFASNAAPLPPDYEVSDNLPQDYWQFAVENAE